MHINLLTIFEILALSENKYAEHCHKHDKFYANATHNFGKYYIKNCSKIRDLTNAQMPKIASSAHNLSHSLYIQTVFASQCSLGIVLKRHTLWYSLLSVHQASIQCPNGVGQPITKHGKDTSMGTLNEKGYRKLGDFISRTRKRQKLAKNTNRNLRQPYCCQFQLPK